MHISDWPEPDGFRADDDLRRRMGLVRRLVTAGRSARTEAKVRVRQPLAKAVVVLPAAEVDDLAELEELLAEELNVKEIEVARGLAELVTYTVKPNFKALGPRFGKQVKDVAAALGRADAYEVVAALERDGTATIAVGGEHVSLTRDELDVRVSGREGFSLAQDGPYGVALDLEVTAELAAEGAAREVVRAVQDLRKSSGLAVEDRIELWLATDDEDVAAALREHEDFVASEVLAVAIELADAPEGAAADEVSLGDGSVRVGLRKSG